MVNSIYFKLIAIGFALSFNLASGADLVLSKNQANAVVKLKKVASPGARFFIYGSPGLDYVVVSPSGKRSGKLPFTDKIFDEEVDASYINAAGVDPEQGGPTAEYQSNQQIEYGTYRVEFFNLKGGTYSITMDIYDEKGDPFHPDKIIKGRLTSQESDKFDMTILKGKKPTFTKPRTEQ